MIRNILLGVGSIALLIVAGRKLSPLFTHKVFNYERFLKDNVKPLDKLADESSRPRLELRNIVIRIYAECRRRPEDTRARGELVELMDFYRGNNESGKQNLKAVEYILKGFQDCSNKYGYAIPKYELDLFANFDPHAFREIEYAKAFLANGNNEDIIKTRAAFLYTDFVESHEKGIEQLSFLNTVYTEEELGLIQEAFNKLCKLYGKPEFKRLVV